MQCCLEVLSPGDGQTYPKNGQTVVVHYEGFLEDGKIFDSSKQRKTPFRFVLGLGQVIRGWEENIPKISINEKIRLKCPPDYAYGSRGFPGVIPPNAVLTFEIELLQLK